MFCEKGFWSVGPLLTYIVYKHKKHGVFSKYYNLNYIVLAKLE
jgi:hypothetical protein